MPYNRYHPFVHMLISTFAFSLMNLSIKYIAHIPAVEVVFFRAVITLIISLWMLRNLGLNPLGNNRKLLLMRGFFGMISLTAFFFTLQKMPLASAVTLQYLSPIFTIFFGIFLLKEKVHPVQWLCFAVAFTGVAIIRGFDERVQPEYLAVGIFSAIFSGVAYNLVRMAKNSDHPLVVVLYFPLVALPFSLVASLFVWKMPEGWDWFWLLLTGIFTQIGQVNLTHALQNEKLASISGLNYLGIIYALFFGYFLFGETYDWIVLAGIFLVLTGVLLNFFLKSERKIKAVPLESREQEIAE